MLPAPIQRLLADFSFPVALGVVTPEGVWAAGECERIYPWMSVTKLVTARAVLAAVEDARMDFDDVLTPAGATVEMLLAHAGGLGVDGEQVCDVVSQRIYSNAGYDILGRALAKAVGIPVGDHLVGMLSEWGACSVAYEASPAWGLRGDLHALAALTRELAFPTRIDPGMWRHATSPAWPGLPGIVPGYGRYEDNTWGLGPEIRGSKRPHWTAPTQPEGVFGHFGQSGSFVWVDAEAGVAACFLSARRFGLIHQRLWPGLNAAVAEAFA